MRLIFLTAILLTISGFSFSQSPLPIGRNQFNAGLGLSGWGVPVYIGFDHSVHKDITIGGELSYRSYQENWNSSKYNHSIMGVSGNGNYHFNSLLNIPQNWDFYAGLNLGFYVWSSPDTYDGNNSSGLGMGAQIGGRYYFSDNIGLNIEFGGGNAFSEGKFGITIKL